MRVTFRVARMRPWTWAVAARRPSTVGDGVGGAYLAPGSGDGEGHGEDATFELGGQAREPAAEARG